MSHGLTLALDGSTYAGSVALIRDREVVAESRLRDAQKPGRGGREEQFMPMVRDCLRDGQVEVSDLARIVCGEGPGSFTSLRVAASIAKGIAFGGGVPLFSVSSLLLIVAGNDTGDGNFLSVLPAMRGESFAAGYERRGRSFRLTRDVEIVAEAEVEELGTEMGAVPVGTVQGSGLLPHARGVAEVLDQILDAGPCDLNSWEPVYGRLAEAQVKWEAAHGRKLA